jgi:cytoskeletal protein CcmA (bactofilin family)
MAGTGAAEQRRELDSGRETALLGRGTRIAGKLSFEGKARIDGEVEGEILCSGMLHIGEDALVNAQINATNIVIHGKVTGDITATKKLEIRSPGKLFGNVVTPSLVIEEGVVFEGHCSMGAREERGKKVTLLAGDEKDAPGAAADPARATNQA